MVRAKLHKFSVDEQCQENQVWDVFRHSVPIVIAICALFRQYLESSAETKKLGNSLDGTHSLSLSLDWRISNALVAGYFMNAAIRCANASAYKLEPLERGPTANTDQAACIVHVHPSSTFAHLRPPEQVVFQDLVHSSKLFMKQVLRVNSKCLQQFQQRYRFASAGQLSGRQEVINTETNDSRTQPNDHSQEKSASAATKGKRSFSAISETSSVSDTTGSVLVGGSSPAELARLRYLARKSGNTF